MPLLMYHRPELVDSSVFRRRLQITLAYGIPHIIQFIGIINTEIRRPTSVVFQELNFYFRHVAAFMDILDFLSMFHTIASS